MRIQLGSSQNIFINWVFPEKWETVFFLLHLFGVSKLRNILGNIYKKIIQISYETQYQFAFVSKQ